jgi:serine/threonine protein kinase
MKTEAARKELKALLVIDDVDKRHRFHMGKPLMCHPAWSSKVAEKVSANCRRLGQDAAMHPTKYSLLLTRYGGVSLAQLQHVAHPVRFFQQVGQVLEGIQALAAHGICHGDIHPGNVVYDEGRGTMRLIDFGEAETFASIEWLCRRSEYQYGYWNWQTPMERRYANRNAFDMYRQAPREMEEAFVQKAMEDAASEHKTVAGTYFQWMGADTSAAMRAVLAENARGWNAYLRGHTYGQFLTALVPSLDVYGAGLTFLHTVQRLFPGAKEAKGMEACFYAAVNPDITRRTMDMKALVAAYGKLKKTTTTKARTRKRQRRKRKKKEKKTKKRR